MDEFQKVLAEAQAAIARGADPGAVNAEIKRVTGLANLPALITQARGGVPAGQGEPEQQESAPKPESGITGFQQGAAAATQGMTFGFAPDIFRLLEKIPGAPDNLDEKHVAALNAGREEHPVRTGAIGLASSILGGPGKLATAIGKGVVKGGAATRGLLAARGATGGTQAAGSVLAGMGIGTAGGALEGDLAARGDARTRGASPEETARAVKAGRIVGGVTGGLLSGIGGTALETKRLLGGTANRRNALIGALDEQSGLSRAPAVLDKLEDAAVTRRAAYDAALEGNVPPTAAQTIMGDPVMRSALENSGSRAGAQFRRRWSSYQRRLGKGLPAEPPEMPAVLVDDVQSELKTHATAAARAGLGRGQNVRFSSREAGEALDRMGGILDDIPGFREAQGFARAEGVSTRAFEAGQKAISESADVAQRNFEKITDPEAREVFRVGMAQNILQKLGGNDNAVKSFITNARQAPKTQAQLRLILGSDAAYDAFMQTVATAAREQTQATIAENLIKYGGFTFFGSSLAGGTAIAIAGT